MYDAADRGSRPALGDELVAAIPGLMHLEYLTRRFLNGGDCWGTHPDGSRRLLRISELPKILRGEVLLKSYCVLRMPPLLDPALLADEPDSQADLRRGVRGAAFLVKDVMGRARACLGKHGPASHRFSSVAVDVGDGNVEYAKLQLLFKVFDHDGEQHDLALVRWYVPVKAPARRPGRGNASQAVSDRHRAVQYAARLQMELCEWASGGDGFAVVSTATLKRIVYMTPSFEYDGFFYLNTIMTSLRSTI
jgi:hypothetical protein